MNILTKLLKKAHQGNRRARSERIFRLVTEAANHPLSFAAHEQLAAEYERQGHLFPAIAEYRTALTLSSKDPAVMLSLSRAYARAGLISHAEELNASVGAAVPDRAATNAQDSNGMTKEVRQFKLETLDHNRYYRYTSLAKKINALPDGNSSSVLDVGGGTGELCLFLPGCDYVLAEPLVNGISGVSLPFEKKSFDFVVACHVLEHIPQAERTTFLDELCNRAKKRVILLNPFTESDSKGELELIVELTGASWAKEHLTCGLPSLPEIVQYAETKGYRYSIEPNGSAPLSFAMVLIDHYASQLKKGQELQKINQHLNSLHFETLAQPALPTAYLVQIDVGRNPK